MTNTSEPKLFYDLIQYQTESYYSDKKLEPNFYIVFNAINQTKEDNINKISHT